MADSTRSSPSFPYVRLQNGARPRPLPNGDVLWRVLVTVLRGSLLATMALSVAAPGCSAAIAFLGLSERATFVFLVVAAHQIPYYSANLFFFLVEWRGYFLRYKLPRTAAHVVDQKLLRQTILEGVVTHWLSQPLLAYYVLYPTFLSVGASLDVRAPTPSALWATTQFGAMKILSAVMMYSIHRLLHTHLLYARFHKQHHMYTGAVSVAAEHASPLEGMLQSLPVILPPLVLQTHPFVMAVWLFWRCIDNTEMHCGYSFRGSWLHRIGLTHSDAAEYHDHHHTRNWGSFGDPALDHIFGTMDAWLVHKRKGRAHEH